VEFGALNKKMHKGKPNSSSVSKDHQLANSPAFTPAFPQEVLALQHLLYYNGTNSRKYKEGMLFLKGSDKRGCSMNKMNNIEVIINNKKYTLRGYESEEYLQKVASYINNKNNDFKKQDFYKLLDSEMKSILMEINIADDYFKVREQAKEIEQENEEKAKEIFELKHELVSLNTKLAEAEKLIASLKDELNENQKKIIRLETELGNRNRNTKG